MFGYQPFIAVIMQPFVYNGYNHSPANNQRAATTVLQIVGFMLTMVDTVLVMA